MRISVLILILIFLLFFLILSLLGTSFNKDFWINFVKDLLPNIVVIFFVVFFIDYLIKNKFKFKKINKINSELICFIADRLCCSILEYLDLVTKQEMATETTNCLRQNKDTISEFEWAKIRLEKKTKNREIENMFFDKLMKASNKYKFINDFVILIKQRLESISKNLDKIYPYPDPTVKDRVREGFFSLGAILAIGDVIQSPEEQKQFTGEQINLLIEIMYSRTRKNLSKIAYNIIWLSEKARKNELFINL